MNSFCNQPTIQSVFRALVAPLDLAESVLVVARFRGELRLSHPGFSTPALQNHARQYWRTETLRLEVQWLVRERCLLVVSMFLLIRG